jgi:hypothetical protein
VYRTSSTCPSLQHADSPTVSSNCARLCSTNNSSFVSDAIQYTIPRTHLLVYRTSSTPPSLQRTNGPGTQPSNVHQVYLCSGLTGIVAVVVSSSSTACTGWSLAQGGGTAGAFDLGAAITGKPVGGGEEEAAAFAAVKGRVLSVVILSRGRQTSTRCTCAVV